MIPMVAIALFAAAGGFAVLRLLHGPGLADRIIALDVMLLSLMGAIVVDAARRGDDTSLILPVVLAIIGFTATVAASRFIEHGGGSDARPATGGNEPAPAAADGNGDEG